MALRIEWRARICSGLVAPTNRYIRAIDSQGALAGSIVFLKQNSDAKQRHDCADIEYAQTGEKPVLIDMPRFIKIIPKCLRADNRVREHGEIMVLIEHGVFNGRPAILVESREKTWRGEFWLGWFTDEEADWEEVESKEP